MSQEHELRNRLLELQRQRKEKTSTSGGPKLIGELLPGWIALRFGKNPGLCRRMLASLGGGRG